MYQDSHEYGAPIDRSEAYQDLFVLFCGRRAPFKFPPAIESLSKLPSSEYEKLQFWTRDNLHCRWMTGIGTLEAFDHMVNEAESNGNLRGYCGGLRFPKKVQRFIPVPAKVLKSKS